MGSVTFGIPKELALSLKGRHGTNYFTETGTGDGDTSLWATQHFASVVTIDTNEPLELQCVHSIRSDSAEWLELFYRTDGPTMFWLDAHTNESCPVLREIAAINRNEWKNVILVDDARLFGYLPAWPTLSQVIEALKDGGRRDVGIIDDVIVAEPCP